MSSNLQISAWSMLCNMSNCGMSKLLPQICTSQGFKRNICYCWCATCNCDLGYSHFETLTYATVVINNTYSILRCCCWHEWYERDCYCATADGFPNVRNTEVSPLKFLWQASRNISKQNIKHAGKTCLKMSKHRKLHINTLIIESNEINASSIHRVTCIPIMLYYQTTKVTARHPSVKANGGLLPLAEAASRLVGGAPPTLPPPANTSFLRLSSRIDSTHLSIICLPQNPWVKDSVLLRKSTFLGISDRGFRTS